MAAPNNWNQHFAPNNVHTNMSWQFGHNNDTFRPEMNTGQYAPPQTRFTSPQFQPNLHMPPPPFVPPPSAPSGQQFRNFRPNTPNYGIDSQHKNQTYSESDRNFFQTNQLQRPQQDGSINPRNISGNKAQVNQFSPDKFAQANFGHHGISASHGIHIEKAAPRSNANVINQVRKEDECWLDKWTSNLKCSAKTESNVKSTDGAKCLKISEAQEKTRRMLVLLAKLQKNRQVLETMIQEDNVIWEQKLNEIRHTKSELEHLQQELSDEHVIKDLAKRISQRRNKRERLKRRRRQMFEDQLTELADREQKHVEIDKAMQQIVEKQKEAKQEADMQKEGDQILSEVRKKITETNRNKQLLTNVQKLRKLRRDRLERQGVLGMCEPAGSASTLMFDARVDSLQSLLQKQMETYRAEEAALKVILETEQEESREKEREKMKKQLEEKQRVQKKKEEKMLFGCQKVPQIDDPLYSFWQFYHQAEKSLEALIAVRRDWDMHLVLPAIPGSSTIPEGWVMPSPPSSDVWSSALHNSS